MSTRCPFCGQDHTRPRFGRGEAIGIAMLLIGAALILYAAAL
jgi:hypothetical protein